MRALTYDEIAVLIDAIRFRVKHNAKEDLTPEELKVLRRVYMKFSTRLEQMFHEVGA